MTLEKKSLTSKKTAPRNTGKKVDSRKVTADKVVTAMRMITTKRTLIVAISTATARTFQAVHARSISSVRRGA